MFVVMSGDINLQFRFFCIFWCLCLCRKVPLAAIVRPWTRFGTQRVPGVNHFLFFVRACWSLAGDSWVCGSSIYRCLLFVSLRRAGAERGPAWERPVCYCILLLYSE